MRVQPPPHRMRTGAVRAALPTLILAVAGCAGVPEKGTWGAYWPTGEDLRAATTAAAKSPRTWGPLAGAALLSVSSLDDDLSDWIADERPLFGSGAVGASDKLRNAAVASYVLSALAVRSESAEDKLTGLGVGIAALYVQGGVVAGLKEASGRRRPNHANDRSFPSGHASMAGAGSALAMHNLRYIDMPSPARTAAVIGLEAMAIGTGWARVEARKHYAADVLAGYALGNFVATFVQFAFIEKRMPGVQVAFHPLEGGGALRLTVPVPR